MIEDIPNAASRKEEALMCVERMFRSKSKKTLCWQNSNFQPYVPRRENLHARTIPDNALVFTRSGFLTRQDMGLLFEIIGFVGMVGSLPTLSLALAIVGGIELFIGFVLTNCDTGRATINLSERSITR